MKVFTVGLDQKPPMDEVKSVSGSEKSDSPPPGYSTTEARVPLPLGPELPRPPLPPPPPIILRKSRGYKGVLLALLAVFLMAVFALTLSEMAWNRQREENFFKLRWAELKHRIGYGHPNTDGPYDYYQRAASSVGEKFDRLLSMIKNNELAEQQHPSTTTTTSPEPVVAIDTFPMAPSRMSGSGIGMASGSGEQLEQPQPLPQGMQQVVRDARLQFLRNILQKIKQHAEDIGFDGTMQVSIIEVEPQNGAGTGEDAENQQIPSPNMMPWGHPRFPAQLTPQQQPFFPHPRPLIDDFKNSRSFLDGFGEMHAPPQPPVPSFLQNNQLQEEGPQARLPPPPPLFFGPHLPPQGMPQGNEQFPQAMQQQQNSPPELMDNMRWSGPPRGLHPLLFRQPQAQQALPEMLFFHPFFPQQQQQHFPEWTPPQALPRPSAFDRWNGAQQQQQFPPQMMMRGQQQQPQQPFQVPPQQQVQIDFPEVKLPPPVISDINAVGEQSTTSSTSSSALPQQQDDDDNDGPRWVPKWAEKEKGQENGPVMVDDTTDTEQFKGPMAGPPGVQPPPPPPAPAQSDMVKFPQVTVVEPAKASVAHNEDGPQQQTQVDGAAPPPAESEKKEQPEETVEVEAPQPIVPQNAPQKTGEQEQQGQPQQQQQFQKWFPEVPSVFFQNGKNSPSGEIEKSEKLFESVVENMRNTVRDMLRMDHLRGSDEIDQVDDPNGAGGGGDERKPAPAGGSSSDHSSSSSADEDGTDGPKAPIERPQQPQPRLVVD